MFMKDFYKIQKEQSWLVLNSEKHIQVVESIAIQTVQFEFCKNLL